MIEYKISIIIPVFNRPDFISDTLFSVESQTHSDWECIVVDDGSTDNTKEVIQEFVKRDKRFKLLTNTRKKGAQGARNTGVLNSSGEWICFLDSDDLLLKNSIKDRLESWEKEKYSQNIGLIYGDFTSFEFKQLHGSAINWMNRNMALCSFSVMLIKKELVFKNYLLDEDFPAWQDDDFVFEIARKFNVLHCGKAVATYSTKEKKDSITQSKKRLYNGMSLMISKRKNILLRDCGIIGYTIWNIRLFVLKLELISEQSIFYKFLKSRGFLSLLFRRIRKILSIYFDVMYC